MIGYPKGSHIHNVNFCHTVKVILSGRTSVFMPAAMGLMMLAITVYVTWLGVVDDWMYLLFAAVFMFTTCIVTKALWKDVRHPASYMLCLDDGRLSWAVKRKGLNEDETGGIQIDQIRALEFTDNGKKAEYRTVGVYIVDKYGVRTEIPSEMSPYSYKEKIVNAVREIRPEVCVLENRQSSL